MNAKDNQYMVILLRMGLILLLPVFGHACSGEVSETTLALSDAPEIQMDDRIIVENSNLSYARAIENWDTVDEVNEWIAENFRYDMQRALQLADSDSRQKVYIYEPAEVFRYKKGVCVDLARFAFETIKAIDPGLDLNYLMIEFEPLIIGDRTFRRHWLVVYREEDQLFVLADTKRPGYQSGPHRHLADFITEYQTFRKRKIIAYKLRDTYKKNLKQKRKKQFKKIKQVSNPRSMSDATPTPFRILVHFRTESGLHSFLHPFDPGYGQPAGDRCAPADRCQPQWDYFV